MVSMLTMTTNGCTPLFLFILYFVVVVTVKNKVSERKNKYSKDQRCSNKFKEEHSKDRTVLGELKNQIKVIKQQCGELCDMRPSKRTNFFQVLHGHDAVRGNLDVNFPKKAVSCHHIWNISMLDEPTRFRKPPNKPPKFLKKYFSNNFTVPIEQYYFDNDVEEFREKSNANWGIGILIIILKVILYK